MPSVPNADRAARLTCFAVLVAAVFGTGVAAAALTVTHSSNTASGTYLGETGGISWFYNGAVGSGKIPTPAPTEGGTSVSSPVRLASASASYAIGTVKAGDAAFVLTMNETASAVASKTIEIKATVYIGGSQISSTAYMETQNTTAAHLYYFFLDTGSTTTTTILITSIVTKTGICTSTCP